MQAQAHARLGGAQARSAACGHQAAAVGWSPTRQCRPVEGALAESRRAGASRSGRGLRGRPVEGERRRFVNDEGKEMERLLGLQHVESCTVVALKEAFVSMLNSHKLPICRLRGQCYDGASNMRDCLSHALQRKDQDIIEARHLIIDVKEQLQDMRDNGWDPLFKRAKEFCDKND
ncbi:uncharacterized protein LOC107304173 [Oryza brachyantha]|uniref:uncharacterized protein LOC107304173 n=1 Tax=Oryza brachyantha TaxID=4533 RepID=UPI000776A842|nr:uncharacterized protein LOC107304173 [Oryza brachyantha]